MGDVLDEAYAIAQCKDCPWYKSCVTPMKFTGEDIRRQLEASPGTAISQQADLGMQNLLSSMASAAQNSILEGCPIFIERLRNDPRLAQKLKKLMQDWGNEEELKPSP
ncbi:MAG TPA: hypothetical protein VMW60_02725 [Dehalococcoidales bacterium]|nr:hypothetical protein [Dehalococcoidales bacterium]